MIVNYKLTNYKELVNALNIDAMPSNIDMFYDLSYQLSTYIFDYRMNHGLSQKDLAKILQIKQSMVSKLESGNYNITLENICNVMAKLDTNITLEFESVEHILSQSSSYDQNIKTTEPISIDDIKKLGAAS